MEGVFLCGLWREVSFLLKVRCHFLDGNLCVLAGLLLSVPLLRGGLFQCDCSLSQALSFPGTLLLPCISPDAAQRSAGVSTREGTSLCGSRWVEKGEVLISAQKAQLFVLTILFLIQPQGSSIQEDFGISLLQISVTAQPGVGPNS